MKESTLSKITAAGAIAKGMAQKALAPNPNPQWTEYEMRTIDEWIEIGRASCRERVLVAV